MWCNFLLNGLLGQVNHLLPPAPYVTHRHESDIDLLIKLLIKKTNERISTYKHPLLTPYSFTVGSEHGNTVKQL